MSGELKYFLNASNDISVDPIDSDKMENAILMKHLVGTLVRYVDGKQFEPYLADRFSSTDQGRTWTFHLREGLTCENGKPINASEFIFGLSQALRLYSASGPIPIISDILGWYTFTKGGDLSGIKATDSHTVTFEFAQPVGSGFLEYLSMPYYGHFCRSNFNGDRWQSKGAIVSSGPYSLVEPLPKEKAGSSPIRLKLRSDWPLSPKTAPENVSYIARVTPDAWNEKHAVIQTTLGWNESEPQAFRRIWGPPDNIAEIILWGDCEDRFFHKKQARLAFRQKLAEVQSQIAFSSKNATLAKSFYPGVDNLPARESGTFDVAVPMKPLTVLPPRLKSDNGEYMVTLATKTLESLGWPYLVADASRSGKDIYSMNEMLKFDIRLDGVVAGSVIEPWVVEMMFCSNLGISFPDPSGEICRYVNGALREGKPFSIADGNHQVSKIVQEDAAVIPIYHSRTTWYFSRDLDVSRLPDELILPSFEDIGMT